MLAYEDALPHDPDLSEARTGVFLTQGLMVLYWVMTAIGLTCAKTDAIFETGCAAMDGNPVTMAALLQLSPFTIALR